MTKVKGEHTTSLVRSSAARFYDYDPHCFEGDGLLNIREKDIRLH